MSRVARLPRRRLEEPLLKLRMYNLTCNSDDFPESFAQRVNPPEAVFYSGEYRLWRASSVRMLVGAMPPEARRRRIVAQKDRS